MRFSTTSNLGKNSEEGSKKPPGSLEGKKMKKRNTPEVGIKLESSQADDPSETLMDVDKTKKKKKKKGERGNKDSRSYSEQDAVEEERVGDDNHKLQSSVTKGEKKSKKNKKNKDRTAESAEISVDEASGEEMLGKDTKKRKSRKNSVEKGPSDHRDANGKSSKSSDGSRKRVSFSGHVEVFPSTVDEKSASKSSEEDLVRGKRFSEEEDEMIKKAVFDYIKVSFLHNSLQVPSSLPCKSLGSCSS